MIDGMITIRKEPGFTSSDVVAKMRGILHMKKIGHTGTLDPAAEGVLPVCLGSATKLAELIGDRDKEYVAVLRLGVTTDTQDMTGTVIKRAEEEQVRKITREDVERTAEQFTGRISQVPPMYSAIWQNGTRLYELARRGEVVERAPRTITIHELEIQQAALPLVTMRVVCSKGTYIRTLCEDMGNALGVGGAMEHLLRTRVGQFKLEDAITLGQLQDLADNAPEKIKNHVLPIDSFFADAPKVIVSEEAFPYLNNGNPLSFANIDAKKSDDPRVLMKRAGTPIRVYSHDGTFYGIYTFSKQRDRMVCEKMFHRVAGDHRPQ
ncbi:MAG: tRNA pseudouridine(55) synthase TruB [Lachnospiraceae bacterium]|nr:tRNA pseudouridine(55) synthase TruB [Lachnospiraceae bacterium]